VWARAAGVPTQSPTATLARPTCPREWQQPAFRDAVSMKVSFSERSCVMPQSVVDIAKSQVIAYNEKDWDKFKKNVSPEVVYDELATDRKTQGVDKVLDILKSWATAMPDSKATVNSETASGNTVVLEMTWRGTNKGPLKTGNGEIPATGKPFEVRACQVIEVANDKVKAVRHYFDMGNLLKQLGVDH
jgi:steroid delta-isomerase-like uncharacterized protein